MIITDFRTKFKKKFRNGVKYLYENYAKIRDQKGVTDYRVSIETGIPKSTFSEWKSGRSKPKTEKLKILADYFGVSIEYFLE
ncbi:helix-turn-helix domain-containing protein [Eubacterium ventriosum]|uniref:helix-turn-helix domain-containing protein n=1 Tax=Eubacterium ventriosum TaxID=39496 RepID=UPI00206199FD|nr:helix-turn-helix transcriptional regulator [Eubacterium ventriosum]MEE0855389.1 helix-turn-helix transcriptional regulator [Eubacterium ventriosum]DAX53152.1 MAG TPA: Repressor protein CI [Caudoviricetes sp.]